MVHPGRVVADLVLYMGAGVRESRAVTHVRCRDDSPDVNALHGVPPTPVLEANP